MGILLNGKWSTNEHDVKKDDGKFIRKDSVFRNFIGTKKFPPQSNRYHLYVSYACPWAHRAIIFRKLKNLENHITLSQVCPLMLENGWELKKDKEQIANYEYLYQVYLKANSSYSGKVTVPILWDKQLETIVNNESSEIIRMLNNSFNNLNNNSIDYYPVKLQNQIDEINDFVYENINNAVYKVGFATKQDIYEKEVTSLFKALDNIDEILSQNKYLVNNQITEADWRLFTTLIRFDHVYYGHFKCNIKQIRDYKNIYNYLKDLYNQPNIKETVKLEHIKKHYYGSHKSINPNGIIPLGPCETYN
tara:strand:- start:51022 stop:51936 length:915 start_codon:yes stop_codon:yes gene_type:complete